jgi:hypothetical protein
MFVCDTVDNNLFAQFPKNEHLTGMALKLNRLLS